MKVIDSMWFNTRLGSCGFVIGEDETTGELKLYAGVVHGTDQSADEQELIAWGTKANVQVSGFLSNFLARFRNGVAGNF